ncbi:hypothetical protein PPL_02325 [Heterostelium album PN500]|uniref:F-box domain-containing protein n=1 Tax=Heterostelium pallidum (strain ATCC 26659 / Pp 5 / PN500) TaxID=670386 RepID=D3B200_HETP5|nr:hypothetical protein PPL_02325 [Heterostelium album PN500]EFA85324.1 hypothetical protein PPL_02325 [Heterostelium album PN500]|eukprot:XP_020437433.1 hypothetical protein PPL_02325 [Heterostelium album PN500]
MSILNLSHFLIQKIISLLDSNIDRICLIFSCKQFFSVKDKILYFNHKYITCTDSELYYHSIFKLKSFKSILIQSIINQSNGVNSLYISHDISDRYISPIDLESINDIEDKDHLTELKINFYYKSIETKLIPHNLKKLILDKFNQNLKKGDLYLDHLEYLNLGPAFSSMIEDGSLPPNLKYLNLGGIVEFPTSLPDGIEYLEFGNRFNKICQSALINLESIEFGNNYNKSFTRCGLELPETLKEIIASFKFYRANRYSNIPTTVSTLTLKTRYRTLSIRRGEGGFFTNDHVLMLNDLSAGGLINTIQADEILIDQSEILLEMDQMDRQLQIKQDRGITEDLALPGDQWFDQVGDGSDIDDHDDFFSNVDLDYYMPLGNNNNYDEDLDMDESMDNDL